MRIRNWLIGLTGALLLVLSGTFFTAEIAVGQDNEWWIFLLDRDTHDLTRVDGDGTVETYDLGPQAEEMFELQFAVAPDGSLAAYCIMEMVEIHTDADVPFMTLILFDLETGENRFEIDLGVSDGCRIVGSGFSEDGGLMSVGLIGAHFGSDEANWRVPIIDLESGDVVRELSANDALVAENRDLFDEYSYFMPEIADQSDDEVVFKQLSWRTGGGYSMEAVRWNWTENTLTAEPDLNNGLWIEETGELIWVEQDDSLPLADPQAPIARRNVVRVRGEDGETRTLFFTGDQVVQQVILINGGRELLIRTYDGYDPDNPVQQESHLIVLDRAGNMRELESSTTSLSRILNTPNGYVTLGSGDDGHVVIAHENGEERLLWEMDVDTYFYIVGRSHVPVADDLEPFVGVE